uniref:D-glycero-alpha-D-manno-heptose 1-phosphate guanylyltransferase n=1 Tax=Candidatus Kentrum sp. SD TaxID=2126332 RepID=A0A451BMM2_9GAMM|nr:MAG: D-glycero-alpha-D-manno-heptose 1-phosphate guanylyltransferase [Candidatus Kentron sp. SD]
MEAIILAGGLGTRLREIVSDVPKPMAPVAGRPFLEILLTTLAHKGFERAIISVGYMAEKVSDYFGSRFENMELIYVVEEEPFGTGGALRVSLEHIESDHAFIFNGDTFLDLETNLIEDQWLANMRPIIVGCRVPDTTRYGRLLQENDIAYGFTEKGTSGPGLINGGCYVLRKGELDSFTLFSKFSFESDFLIDAVARGEFDVFVTKGRFIDIGVPEDYYRAEEELKDLID